MISEYRKKLERLDALLEWLSGLEKTHITMFGRPPNNYFGRQLSEFTVDELIELIEKLKGGHI